MNAAGALTISIDLELLWGVHDRRHLSSYGNHILAARAAIPRLLDLFARHGRPVHVGYRGLPVLRRQEGPHRTSSPSSCRPTPTPPSRRTSGWRTSATTNGRIPITTACPSCGASRSSRARKSERIRFLTTARCVRRHHARMSRVSHSYEPRGAEKSVHFALVKTNWSSPGEGGSPTAKR